MIYLCHLEARRFLGVLKKNTMKILTNYIKSSFEELSKVVWPTKNQAVKLTIIVLVFCLIVAVVLGVVDYVFSYGYNYLLKLTS